MNEIKQQVKKAGKYPVENFSAAEDDEPFENEELMDILELLRRISKLSDATYERVSANGNA